MAAVSMPTIGILRSPSWDGDLTSAIARSDTSWSVPWRLSTLGFSHVRVVTLRTDNRLIPYKNA